MSKILYVIFGALWMTSCMFSEVSCTSVLKIPLSKDLGVVSVYEKEF